jgi:2-keto-4-pentenoate hydratase/2-oxohepta-3-ene-1,7-dioic acid hydratase in catechol pathway
MKPLTAVIGQEAPIILPPQSQRVDHEAELAIGSVVAGVDSDGEAMQQV